MKNLLVLPKNKDAFIQHLIWAEKEIGRIFFMFGPHLVREYEFYFCEGDDGEFLPKIKDDTVFEMGYILKRYLHQEEGRFVCDFDQILCSVVIYDANKKIDDFEIQTGSFTVVFKKNSFSVRGNDYWSYKNYDLYIKAESERRNLEIIS